MKLFEKTYVINLKRRKDRLDGFFREIEKNNVSFNIEVFEAVDGLSIDNLDKKWIGRQGIYGCRQSHLTILDGAIKNNLSSYLVFEDDACFIDSFNEKLSSAIDNLPNDWELFFLGGQVSFNRTQEKPKLISGDIFRAIDVFRTHAFAVRITENIKRLRDEIKNNSIVHHVDDIIGRFCRNLNAYIVLPQLVGQRESFSDILLRNECERYWNI